MIYTPENSPGLVAVDVSTNQRILDVLAVDMDNASVSMIDRPLRMLPGQLIAMTKKRFTRIEVMTAKTDDGQMKRLFVCEGEIQPDTKE